MNIDEVDDDDSNNELLDIADCRRIIYKEKGEEKEEEE
jgi:hypothetical protein